MSGVYENVMVYFFIRCDVHFFFISAAFEMSSEYLLRKIVKK